MISLDSRFLGEYDVAVCGGGIAGVGAAVTAARNGASVVLIESLSSLGGTLTEGYMTNINDRKNKGGLVLELLNFLNQYELTCPYSGKMRDADGNHRPGPMVDAEATKYFFEKICTEAGVRILYSSTVAGVDHTDGHVNRILVATYCGNYELSARLYIDATGNGALSALAGLKWECGDPPNPASMSISVGGLPDDYEGTDTIADRDVHAALLKEHGIDVSARQVSLKRMPTQNRWNMGFNFEYNVMPDNIERLSDAIVDGRREAFELIQKHRVVKGFENMHLLSSCSYFGIREGRRFFGLYRLTLDDIMSGATFEDGICPVTARVDVHMVSENDTTDHTRGLRSQPYQIPYRCLVPEGSDNILLAGRLISGDFYPFSSYRMIGNMATVGEAAGYAAALCIKQDLTPAQVDGTAVKAYMASLGHDL